MNEFVASLLLILTGLLLTRAAIRLNRLTLRLRYFAPLEYPLAEIERRHLAKLWDRRPWSAADYAFWGFCAVPTVLFLLATKTFAAEWPAYVSMAIASLFLTAMAACDRRCRCLPPPVLIFAVGAGLLLSITPYGLVTPAAAIAGATLGLLLTGLTGFCFTNLLRRMSLGPADPWLAAAIGALVGPGHVANVLILSVVVYFLSLLPDLITGGLSRVRHHLRHHFPFGAPLAIAASYFLAAVWFAPNAVLMVDDLLRRLALPLS